jgi:hypothetical protein
MPGNDVRTDPAPRILFLDDDPQRAAAFALEYPRMVWVQTVEDCLGQLAEPWDVVHLDHDLGGETFVDGDRDDCGMAVVRWLSGEPRPHLKETDFVIHSHNENAACVMALHLEEVGYRVKSMPFGSDLRRTGPLARVAASFARLFSGLRG